MMASRSSLGMVSNPMSRIIIVLLSETGYIETFEKNIRFSLNKKTAGLKPTASKKKTTGFFFRLPMVFNKLVLFYLAGPWIDFLKKKPSKKLKKPK
jgi:hypothetical protein